MNLDEKNKVPLFLFEPYLMAQPVPRPPPALAHGQHSAPSQTWISATSARRPPCPMLRRYRQHLLAIHFCWFQTMKVQYPPCPLCPYHNLPSCKLEASSYKAFSKTKKNIEASNYSNLMQFARISSNQQNGQSAAGSDFRICGIAHLPVISFAPETWDKYRTTG